MREWIIVKDGDTEVERVEAGGRRQALANVQRRHGGMTHGTGGFYDALLGSDLGGAVTAWTRPEWERMQDGERPRGGVH